MQHCDLVLRVLANFILLMACAGRAAAQETLADVFSRDFGALARQSTQTGIPIACGILPAKGENVALLADYRIRAGLKWFLPLAVQPNAKIAKALNADTPTAVAVLDGKGQILGRAGPTDSVSEFFKQLQEIAKAARANCLLKLGNEGATTAESKNAVSSLVRLGGTAAELMPLLRHKSADVKVAVAKALPTLSADEVALAAFEGLASEDVEMRAACFRWATAATSVPKPPPLKFWREADKERRNGALEAWREAAMVDMGPLNKEILDFCEANLGKKVRDGECAHLAEEALKIANGQPIQFSGKTYIWGREVTAGQRVLPGDIVQLEDCKFINASASHHTQIIRRVVGPRRYEVLEQNMNGRRTVGPGELDLNRLLEGDVKIYRPLPR